MKTKLSIIFLLSFLLIGCSSNEKKEISFIEDFLTVKYTNATKEMDIEEIQIYFEKVKPFLDEGYLDSYYAKRKPKQATYTIFGKDVPEVNQINILTMDIKKLDNNNFTYKVNLEINLQDETIMSKELSGTITLNKNSRKIQYDSI